MTPSKAREEEDEIVARYGEHDGSPSECFALLEQLIVEALEAAEKRGRIETLKQIQRICSSLLVEPNDFSYFQEKELADGK